MYVLSFIATYFILRSETARKKLPLTKDDVADLVFYGAMGVVLGGALGYILFYNLGFYLANPLKLFAVWEGGMSFHGGFLGVIAGLCALRPAQEDSVSGADRHGGALRTGRAGAGQNRQFHQRRTLRQTDRCALGDGLSGRRRCCHGTRRSSTRRFWKDWCCFLSSASSPGSTKVNGVTTCAACAGYGLFRFIVEFFRQPDAQIGLFFSLFSMGQLLSLPMFIAGHSLQPCLLLYARPDDLALITRLRNPEL